MENTRTELSWPEGKIGNTENGILSFEFSLSPPKAILGARARLEEHQGNHEESESRDFWSERSFRRGTS